MIKLFFSYFYIVSLYPYVAWHGVVLFSFSAARYQNELAGVDAEQLAERFYHQALSVMPHIGEWLEWSLLSYVFCLLIIRKSEDYKENGLQFIKIQ